MTTFTDLQPEHVLVLEDNSAYRGALEFYTYDQVHRLVDADRGRRSGDIIHNY